VGTQWAIYQSNYIKDIHFDHPARFANSGLEGVSNPIDLVFADKEPAKYSRGLAQYRRDNQNYEENFSSSNPIGYLLLV